MGPAYDPSGPAPIVFLHGLMGFSANWGKIWPYFQEHRPVLVLDQRGHGRSAKPPAGYSPSDYAQDLSGLLDSMGWGECHIVGHSMGGRVALRFASLFPLFTRSLTLEDSGTEASPERISWIKELLASIPTPFPSREEAKRFFEKRFGDEPMLGGFLHANLETKDDGTLDWRFHAPGMLETIEKGRALDASAELRSVSCPTLIVRGSRSREFPAEEAMRMAGLRENIQLVEIEEAGHFVHAEKPVEFSAALEAFLKKIERA
jgi:esterase